MGLFALQPISATVHTLWAYKISLEYLIIDDLAEGPMGCPYWRTAPVNPLCTNHWIPLQFANHCNLQIICLAFLAYALLYNVQYTVPHTWTEGQADQSEQLVLFSNFIKLELDLLLCPSQPPEPITYKMAVNCQCILRWQGSALKEHLRPKLISWIQYHLGHGCNYSCLRMFFSAQD